MHLHDRAAISSVLPENILFIEWNSQIEYFTYSDDLKIHSWDGSAKDSSAKTITLNKGTHILDIDCMNISQQSIDQRKRSSEMFAIGTSDGKCYIMHKSGRTERVIDAHKGAVMNAKWNHDGTSLLTSGEDGQLKIWSRSGMLRSTHTQADSPIYSAVWSPFSTGVLYSSGKLMTIQSFATTSKTLQWKAHDSVVLVVAWSSISHLIASGSEDCHFKIWDPVGQLLFNSDPRLHPITSIAWSPDGAFCAFTTFSSVCVSSAYGSDILEGSMEGDGISSVCWSPEGSQLVVGNSTGRIQISHLVKGGLTWGNYHVTKMAPNTLELRDHFNETVELLEFRDDVLLWSFNYGHFLVASQTHCLIHKENGWNSPITVELRDKCPQFIKQTEKYFLIMDCGILYVFSYDGALQGTPRISNQRLTMLTADHVTAAKEVIAARSPSDGKSIHCCHYRTGKPVYGDKPLAHSGGQVTKLELDPGSPSGDQLLAFTDTARDLHLLSLSSGLNRVRSSLKIAGGVTSFAWNCDCSMLVMVREEELCVVPYPPAVPNDPALLEKFTIRQNIREYGKHVTIESFTGHQVTLQRGDGLTFPVYLSPYPSKLQQFVSNGQWDSAQRLCSSIKMEILWVCLAAMAVHYKQLDAAQVAFAALRETDKILYVDAIKKMNNVAMIKAETALLQNGRTEAETILLQAGLPLKAIMLNLQLFQFEKALELAVKHDSNIDVVVAYRRKYLEQFSWTETIPRFIEYAKKVDIDWDAIEEKLMDE
ncbi:intraflagellar transport protein 80 homolog [Daphnia pulex]|uniref:intraflagellar transport protein 80 homolog n=1 Tax=Daphnia pulex TaxID=6669 RepID=UPI001EE0F6CD|nr:intraflagellar transport protein 80 homolog [Daphnia pulex]